MEWTESAVTGRQLRAFLWPLRDHKGTKLSTASARALQCLLKIVQNMPSRVVYARSLMRRYRIAFTDARGRAKNATCNRWGHEGIGGVLLSAEGIFFFFASASQSDVEAWLPPQREARINEAESLRPLLLSSCPFTGKHVARQ